MWVTVLVAGCAPTTGPVSPPLEVLVVLDRDARSLTLVAVDSTELTLTIPLGLPSSIRPTTLAVRGAVAAVGLGDTDSVMIVDLGQLLPLRTIAIPGGAPIAAIAFGVDGVGYVASPKSNRVTKFDPATGQVAPVFVNGGPQGFEIARGTVFVVLGNREVCYPVPTNCLTRPSWLTPLEPGPPFDSIPLLGPGNASSAALGADGFLYVLNTGNGDVEGRLSVVDPVQRREVASFSGFGVFPQFLAADGTDRLFIASSSNGLMEFNTRERRTVRGAGQGVPLGTPLGVLTDALGRVYVLEAGPCVGGVEAQVRVFGSDLVARRAITTGSCPIAMALTEIPIDPFSVDP